MVDEDGMLNSLGIDPALDTPGQDNDLQELKAASSTVMFVFASLKLALGMRRS